MSLKRPLALQTGTLSLMACAGAVLAVAAIAGRVGADARWLAALGHLIVVHHSIPAGIPFAPRASAHWPNVPVLAEVISSWLEGVLGDRGLMLAQLAAAGVAMGVLVRDSLSGGAKPVGAARTLLLAGAGSLGALAIARAQLFSLALFPVLCWLLRAETRRPSWRIWLAVPLLALWSNLHGAALLGLAILVGHLLLSRLRQEPLVALAVAVAGAAALCATPAFTSTVAYYHGVLWSPMALTGQGMWTRLSLSSPLDVAFLLCAVALLVQFVRVNPPGWEKAVALGLALLSIQAARNGVWLMLFLTPPAARAFSPRRQWRVLLIAVAAASAGLLVFAVARGPVADGASPRLLAQAVSLAHGSPVLAEDVIAEQVALAGGSVVAADPIDAFSTSDQRAYLGWMDGSRGSLGQLERGVRVILVARGSPAARLMATQHRFLAAGRDRRAVLYRLAGA